MVGRALHAWVIPEQVSVAEAIGPSTRRQAADPRRKARCWKSAGKWHVLRLHNSAQVQEFLRLWEAAPLNPGASGDA